MRLTATNQLQAFMPVPAPTFVPLSITGSVRPRGAPPGPACRLHLWVRRQARATTGSPCPDCRLTRATRRARRRRRDPERGGLGVPPPPRSHGQQGLTPCFAARSRPAAPHTLTSCLHA